MKKPTSHPTLALTSPLVRFTYDTDSELTTVAKTYFQAKGQLCLLLMLNPTILNLYIGSSECYLLTCHPSLHFILFSDIFSVELGAVQSTTLSFPIYLRSYFCHAFFSQHSFLVSATSLTATTLLRSLCAGHSHNSLHFCVINDQWSLNHLFSFLACEPVFDHFGFNYEDLKLPVIELQAASLPSCIHHIAHEHSCLPSRSFYHLRLLYQSALGADPSRCLSDAMILI